MAQYFIKVLLSNLKIEGFNNLYSIITLERKVLFFSLQLNEVQPL